MTQNRLCAALAAGCLLLLGCGATESSSELSAETSKAASPTPQNMVVLGDSISYGYGLESPETQRYSSLLTNWLSEKDECTWKDYNYAVSGDDSSDLIKRLENGKAVRLPSANVIILGIGANNLLGAFTGIMTNALSELDISMDSMSDENLHALQDKMEATMQNPDEVLQNLQQQIDQNLQQLETDLPIIAEMLRSRNAVAEVYVLNVYNPYRESNGQLFPESDIDEATFIQSQIDRCNAILLNWCNENSGFCYVDIADAFAETEPVPVIGTRKEHPDTQYGDPHPNATGQNVIAEQILKTMRGKS